tara:strand:+ start:313 stop:540 length:228 start_codon:yes stop_codon:yes gene_type:complete
MKNIRKISIGANYKDAMHYVVGNDALGGKYKIYEISQSTLVDTTYSVWIINKDKEVVKWKEFKNIPITIEFNIDI